MKLKLPELDFLKYSRIPRPMMIWLVGSTFFIAGLEIAWLKGAIQAIYLSDVTKISVLIGLIFLWQSVVCGKEIWCQVQKTKSGDDSSDHIESGWLWSDIVLSLGMIGTVIGFMIMLAGFVGVDFSDFDSVQTLITRLSAGMSTSLSTTLVGLIASVILKLQFFNLENIAKNRNEEKQVL
tara:strand:+ start:1401 stop:1940 length:540 start_codon:yes stop_codon:yes gene_type:complete